MIKDVIIHDGGVDTVMEDPVVTAAQIAFSARIKGSSDVSENTKNAQAVAKAWRGTVHTLDPDRFQIEALVTHELDQKLDILDTETPCAYEFKVSGKNAWAEFYKDIVKVIIWNERRKKKVSAWFSSRKRNTGGHFLALRCRVPTSSILRNPG
jgi:putative lipoic acid-binding regulatory protein